MNKLILTLTAATLVLLAVPLAAADHDGTCPAYTQRAGAGGAEVAFNEEGQALAGAGGFYVTWDYTFGLTGTDQLFSLWIYQESNGNPGLQRDDETCSNTHDGEEPDVFCIC